MIRRRVRRARHGRFQLELPAEERALLRQLVDQLEAMLTEDSAGAADPSLRRLFPPAYTDEPEAEAEYRQLVHDDLVERRRAALSTVTSTVDATDLGAEELGGWLSAINDLRLVLGTRLDVQDDTVVDIEPTDPEAATRALYLYLSVLEEEVVEALAKG